MKIPKSDLFVDSITDLFINSGALLFIFLHVLGLTFLLVHSVALKHNYWLSKLYKNHSLWLDSFHKYFYIFHTCCSLTVEHSCSCTVVHCCSWTVLQTCSLTVLHCCSFTVLHSCSWTVSWTDIRNISHHQHFSRTPAIIINLPGFSTLLVTILSFQLKILEKERKDW